MVNNYVKADILDEPSKKKYSNDHLGYLLAITSLKRVLSMSEISMLIEMDKDVSTDKSILYGFFNVMAKDIMQENASKVSKKTGSFVATYQRELSEGNPNAEQNLRDRLGLIALRLAIQADVNGIMDIPKSSKSSSASSLVSVSSLTVMVSLSISSPPEANALYYASKLLYKYMIFYCILQFALPL